MPKFVPIGEFNWTNDYSFMYELTCKNHPTAQYLTKNPYHRSLRVVKVPEGDIERSASGECTCPFSDLVVVIPQAEMQCSNYYAHEPHDWQVVLPEEGPTEAQCKGVVHEPVHIGEKTVGGSLNTDAGFVEFTLHKGDTAWNPKTNGQFHGPCTVIYYQPEYGDKISAKRERG
jgi:hypothetical protein